eukprot:COSAG05_NODE_3393_length_2090_cov_1.195379_3_plen_224_part_00
MIQAEGSPMGPLIRAVNQIARSLAADFPQVAVDTLAYQYTQPPPTITVPEPNVIIRLCDISSNMGAPLTDPSNEMFAKVIAGWNAISKRIYIWNYVVDFGDLVMSFPNYYSLGPNVDFFAAHGVRGIFEEGPGMGPGDGTDMEELKDYGKTDRHSNPDEATLIHVLMSRMYPTVVWPTPTIDAILTADCWRAGACCCLLCACSDGGEDVGPQPGPRAPHLRVP